MKTAERLNGVGEYYFSQKLREIEVMNGEGRNVINLGIGSPDLPPHPDVIKVLQEESAKPNVHAYQSYKGSPVLRKAMSDWYKKWYGVQLNPDSEILPLIGSKEGIMHICMTYINHHDEVLVPNPGYPTYKSAVMLAGGKCIEYELLEENKYYPDLSAIERRNSGRVKLMFVNYPHMPTGQPADKACLEKMVRFAQSRNILIVHDNPYSFILNDNPVSLLSIDGAKDCVIELNSLSKSHNMAGWRVGMLCGAKEKMDAVLRFKSNMDSGMFLPVQLAAAKALSLEKEWYEWVNKIYADRRKKVFELLRLLKCEFSTTQAGMFVWAKTPAGLLMPGGEQHPMGAGGYLSDQILYKCGVFITPGAIFGSAGNDYIRVSLCSAEEKFEEARQRLMTIY